MAGWSSEATKALISIWGEQNIQEQLDGVSRNKSIYEKIAAAMRAKGTDLIISSVERKSKSSLPNIAR